MSCTYCKRNHSFSKCTVITDANARKAFLQAKGRCFICLKSGHVARDCMSQNLCYKCYKRHHISICDSISSSDSSNNIVSTTPTNRVTTNMENNINTNTFLQTAKGKASGLNSNMEIRLIFDS